ncbi:hypothetical protein BS47DRAFT_1339267 [Hydnum rufescens UP504]|uniref:C3H1-type domain-containing protein n=1 Tax=Hydnum rufescens UP504 TaxID=1448309 RepID=A0A9P6B4U1_9AGAM|nr:hypothetical protein BS47DRAFT_1339267 [Hydnum rufescens UP504]
MCLIDGDGCVFSPHYLIKGESGGEQAATQLKQELVRHIGGGTTLCTFVYLNHTGLRNFLATEGSCTPTQFNEFVTGFNRSTELFCIVDVGRGKEAADAKIREMLRLFTGVPQIKKIFFGGGHDSGYRTVLNSLRTDGLGDKVIMLDNGDNARAIAELDLNLFSIPGLFVDKSTEAELVVRPNEVGSPLPSPPLITSSPVLISARPMSPIKGDTKDQNTYSAKAAGILSSALNVAPRPIGYSKLNKPKESDDGPKVDRTKAMIHQKPTICNDFYLNTCFRFECPYSHEYDLTEKHIAKLRAELKTMPCKGSRGCPGPEECWYRH